ncbi:MAG: DnaA/Hda family protein, partial [Pseudomonadota bacterium]
MDQHENNTRRNYSDAHNQDHTGDSPGAHKIWEAAQTRVRDDIGEEMFGKWVADLRFVAEVHDKAVIAVRDQVTLGRIKRDYERLIRDAWLAEDDKQRELRFVCWKRAPKSLLSIVEDPWLVPEATEEAAKGAAPQMTFDTLIVGASNTRAVESGRRFAAGKASAPILFVSGRQGVGKTHLLRAIENEALANGSIRVTYMTAEEFMSAYVQGAQERDTRALKAKLRNSDLVLIDDLQWIKGKKGTDQAFFANIRAVTSQGGHVVLTADEAPGDMRGLSTSLMNELRGAASVAVETPDDEMRAAILRQHEAMIAESDPNFVLTDEMISRILSRVRGPGRELCGVLWSLQTESCFGKEPITMEMLDTVIRRQAGETRPPSIDLIKRAAAATFGVTKTNLESASKAQVYVYPRQI